MKSFAIEAKEEDKVLTERIDNLKKNPSSAVSWRKVRCSNRKLCGRKNDLIHGYVQN